MKAQYIRAMSLLHRLCIVISVICLVTMTLIIPWGVFTRYVLNYGSSWPEPMAILLMIFFSFFAAAACYRDNLHIAVMAVPNSVPEPWRSVLGYTAEVSMVIISIFMAYWGTTLVQATLHQTIGEFPILSVGITYAPIPIGGTITLLFVIERLWTGAIFVQPDESTVASVTTE